jgi:hypothetical protein
MRFFDDIYQDSLKELNIKYELFYAFNKEQFDEALKIRNRKDLGFYVNISYGAYIPNKFKEEYKKELDILYKKSIQIDIEENGKDKIILRELNNHECFYTGEIDDAVDAVHKYGYTSDDVYKIYKKELKNN